MGAEEEQVKRTNMRIPPMSTFRLSTSARSNLPAWVMHMDQISAELSTVGVDVERPSSIAAGGLEDHDEEK